jgi:alanine racemase
MNINIESPTRVYIDTEAFRNNINIVRKKFPESKIVLPVKANAYGHGSTIISKEAEKIGIDYLAIARLNEGLVLRNNGIKLPVMCLGVEYGINIKTAILNKIELSVSSLENIYEIEKIASETGIRTDIHLKIDTGMSRLGFQESDVINTAKYIKSSKYLNLKTAYTHFARSDDSKDFTNKQIDDFFHLRDALKKENLMPDFFHFYNSGAILDSYRFDSDFAVRPGIMSYGYSPYESEETFGLKPVMTFVSKVIHIKKVPKLTGVSYNHTFVTGHDTILATIPVGYGDGIFRNLSNKLKVNINGKTYSQRGTITMDLMLIEVDENVKTGDDVFVFGNKNECFYDAKDLAGLSQTISYDITTSISERVDRIRK